MLEIIIHGGFALYIITFCSIVSLGITLERWRTLRKADIDSEGLLNRLSDELDKGNLERAIQVAEEAHGPVGDTLAIGLRKLLLLERIGKKPEEIEEGIVAAMEEHGLHVINYLERNLTALATVSSLAPILGMMGTVFGMIHAFNDIATSDAMGRPELLARGISEALLTTAMGLMVAVPAQILYWWFVSVVDRLTVRIDALGQEVVGTISAEAINEAAQSKPVRTRKPAAA
jgi:biopolymer transport protein ExbB